MTRAKLFEIGSSQAVRLPAESRFEGDEVEIRRDSATGLDQVLQGIEGCSPHAHGTLRTARVQLVGDLLQVRQDAAQFCFDPDTHPAYKS